MTVKRSPSNASDLDIHHPVPIGSSSFDEAMMEDKEVNEFLYDAVAHMPDSNVDETATQAADSPPSYAGTSGELDGIDGRSFQHAVQRQMQRERMEMDAASRRVPPPEALPIPGLPNHHLHGVNGYEHQLQQQQRQEPQLQPSIVVPRNHLPRRESSLAHAFDDTYMQQASSTPLHANSPFAHELTYPLNSPHPAVHMPLPQPQIFTPPALTSPGLLEHASGPMYLKHSWDDEDPNDYLVRASEQSSAFNDPALSYAAASAANATQWSTLSHPVSYPYTYNDENMS